jgi:hypothetical protein
MKRFALIAVLCICAASGAAKQRSDGYILCLDAETRISSLDVQTLVAVDESLHCPVLWVRRDGRRFEIRDPSILARAAEAVRPLTKVNKEYETFQSRARPAYKEEEDLDREIDAIEDAVEKGEHPAEARLGELQGKRRELAQRLRAVEAEDREIDARQERAEAVFERILDGIIDEAMRAALARRID